MTMFGSILVPIDFSEPSKRALDYGLTLATRLKAKLIMAHIVPKSSAIAYAFPIENMAIETKQPERAAQELRALVADERARHLDLQQIVKVGDVEEDLLEIVKEQSVDLVVMGSHGRRYFRRWFLGSVTEHILRKVPAPILTVSHIDDERHPLGSVMSFKRLLYATDLGDSAGNGMACALELARQFSSELTVMSVVEYLNLGYEAASYFDNERTARLQETQRRLDAFAAANKLDNVQVNTLVVDGKAYERILAVAEERNIDCIVLNLQSKSMMERALLGSTAERVVRLAHIPVLSIPFSTATLADKN
jgi:nucleotide-binding universal stress UspA family protein